MKKKIAILASIISLFSYSQNVQLDPTFGPSGNPINIGVVTSGLSVNVLPHYSQIRTISITSSGDIVSFGSVYDINGYENYGISKYNSNGSLDNSFGNNGLASYSWYQSDPGSHYFGDRIYCGDIQSTDKILAAGFTEENGSGYGNGVIYREACLLRLNDDGSVDSTFGVNGKITGNYNGHIASTYHDVLVLPNDYFYSILEEYDTSGYYTSSIAKHKSDGTFDSTFAVNGIASDGDHFTGWGLGIQNDSKILVVGYGYYDSSQAVIKRYNTNGSIDSTFGVNGKVFQDFGQYNSGEERYSQVLIQTDGKIVVSGWAGNLKDTTANEYSTDMVVARYNLNGLLDNTFGVNGIIRQDILSLDPNEGRINRTYAGGVILSDDSFLFNSYEKSNYSHTGDNQRLGFFKYTSNGILDNSFGNNGHYNVTLLTDSNDYINIRMDDMLLLANNKVLLGGSFVTGSGYNTYPYVSNILIQLALTNSIGTDELLLSNDLKIYPNPSSDIINVQHTELKPIKEINILSIDGKVMESFVNLGKTNSISLNISSVPRGTYIIQVKSKKGNISSSTFIKK
jgi:uncharacterized delta-60 repeat protein